MKHIPIIVKPDGLYLDMERLPLARETAERGVAREGAERHFDHELDHGTNRHRWFTGGGSFGAVGPSPENPEDPHGPLDQGVFEPERPAWQSFDIDEADAVALENKGEQEAQRVVELVFFVDGQRLTVEAFGGDPLRVVCSRAIAMAGGSQHPVEAWEVCGSDGKPIDTDRLVARAPTSGIHLKLAPPAPPAVEGKAE